MITKTKKINIAPISIEIPSKSPSNVTPRSFAVGLLLALAMCAVMPYNDYYIGATYLSGNLFPIGGVAALAILTLLVNPILIRMGKRKAIFTPGEIITVWAMIVVVAGIPSSGLMRYLIPHIVAPHYYATVENGWESTIIAHLPSRLLVSDPAAVKQFFEGLKRGGSIPWSAWLEPLAWWGLFVVLLFSAFFCFSALVRRQWVENDRLSFPLARVPIMLAEQPEQGQSFNKLLRSPLLWVSVGLVTAVHTIKGLHLFIPAIPDVMTSIDLTSYLTVKPWNGLGGVQIAVYPLIIGFAYLLPSEVCFSLWFFYLVSKVQEYLATLYNWDISGPGTGILMGPGFLAYQEAGGALMLAAWLTWSMRRHLRDVWLKATKGDVSVDDRREPMPYRLALFGFIGSYVGLFLWMTLVANVAPAMATAVLGGSYVIFLMLSWLVAQSGILFMQESFAPSQITTVLNSALGGAQFGAGSLLMGTMVEHVAWYDARELMLPSILNAQKASGESGLSSRSLMKAMAVCVGLATVIAACASIWLPYTHGGGSSLPNKWMYQQAPQIPFAWTATQLHSSSSAQAPLLVSNAVGGAVFVLVLFLCRNYIPAFGLHPAGFLVAATYPIYAMWFSFMLGWFIKTPIMRYGGIRVYQNLMPLFLGLILGDSLNAIVWTIIGLITHTGYSLLPG